MNTYHSSSIVFQQYYTPKDQYRRSELIACSYLQFINILSNGSEALLLSEPGFTHPMNIDSSKTISFCQKDRITYLDWINLTKTEHIKRNKKEFTSILLNADCFIEATEIKKIETLIRKNSAIFIAMSRHDYYSKNCHKMPKVSQDLWAFSSKFTESILKNLISKGLCCDFPLGKPGCDNRIASIMLECGLNVINPCDQIKCWHIHRDAARNYSELDRIQGKYLFVEPQLYTT